MPAPKRVTFTEHEDNLIRRAYSVGCYGTCDKGPIATGARLGKSTVSGAAFSQGLASNSRRQASRRMDDSVAARRPPSRAHLSQEGPGSMITKGHFDQ